MTPVLKFAPGVTLMNPPTPGGSRILGTAERCGRLFAVDMLCTSGTDSHAKPDPHARGDAFDFATVMWTPDIVLGVYHWMQAELGPLFYIQYEAPPSLPVKGAALAAIVVRNPGATGEHLHVQVAKGVIYPPV